MLVGGRRLRNSAFCDRMDENVNIIERVVNGARMDIIEPVTDSDQVRIFTPEVVRELIKGLTIRELYPEERIRPLTLDDIEVHVFRKRKGRRSSGEILIVKGSIGESPSLVSCLCMALETRTQLILVLCLMRAAKAYKSIRSKGTMTI